MRPSKYNEVKKSMDALLNQTVYSEFITEPSIAYTNSRSNDLCGTVYRLYVNNKDVELAEYLYLHECGHIIFGHVKNMAMRMDRFLLAKISVAYAKISHYFPTYDEYLKVFRTVVFNIVMDFEVNSRLFSTKEWDFMNSRVEKLLGQKGVKGLWPEDYGYPPKLTWNEYLTLILMDPEKFMSQFKDFLEETSKDNGLSDALQTKGEKLSEEALAKLCELEKEHGKGTFEINIHREAGRGNFHGNSKYQTAKLYLDMKKLIEDISKVLTCKVLRPGHNDVLYNYNRNKYSSDVLIPKRTSYEVYQPSNLYILLDVSSSVNENLVYSIIRVFREMSDKYSKTVFVTWNTDLVAEWNIKDNIIIKGGGGTNLESGIEYIKNKYKPSGKDVFFVMSDFMDNLDGWKTELSTIKAKKYAVNWCPCYTPENPGFKKVFAYTGR